MASLIMVYYITECIRVPVWRLSSRGRFDLQPNAATRSTCVMERRNRGLGGGLRDSSGCHCVDANVQRRRRQRRALSVSVEGWKCCCYCCCLCCAAPFLRDWQHMKTTNFVPALLLLLAMCSMVAVAVTLLVKTYYVITL